MHNSDYLREEAARFRSQAQSETDTAAARELAELAEICDEVACEWDDLRKAG
ncbi:MAG: hypothetical protein AB7F96_04070 [Beijerinckiaceae bacterium]